MRALEREEATKVVKAVVADLVANATIDAGRPGSLFRLACGDLLAAAEQLIDDGAIAAPLANLFNLARVAGATFNQFDAVRADTAAMVVHYFAAWSIGNTCIRLCLIQCARILSLTDFVSRPQVDDYLDRMNPAFDDAESLAGNSKDQASYQSLVALHAAVSYDLTTRERTLPTIVVYNFAKPRPALWLCNRLYGGESRSVELVGENKPVHPAFMQMPVRALSQ
jgi:prophage DNA circulation protein